MVVDGGRELPSFSSNSLIRVMPFDWSAEADPIFGEVYGRDGAKCEGVPWCEDEPAKADEYAEDGA